MLDEILDKFGLKYGDLLPDERDTINSWLEALKRNQITVEKVREYVLHLKSSVEKELSKEPTFLRIFIFKIENPQIIRLQARLRNYLLLEAFLTSPQKAKEQLEQMLSNIKPKA